MYVCIYACIGTVLRKSGQRAILARHSRLLVLVTPRHYRGSPGPWERKPFYAVQFVHVFRHLHIYIYVYLGCSWNILFTFVKK